MKPAETRVIHPPKYHGVKKHLGQRIQSGSRHAETLRNPQPYNKGSISNSEQLGRALQQGNLAQPVDVGSYCSMVDPVVQGDSQSVLTPVPEEELSKSYASLQALFR